MAHALVNVYERKHQMQHEVKVKAAVVSDLQDTHSSLQDPKRCKELTGLANHCELLPKKVRGFLPQELLA